MCARDPLLILMMMMLDANQGFPRSLVFVQVRVALRSIDKSINRQLDQYALPNPQ